jgi:hypothetical protein
MYKEKIKKILFSFSLAVIMLVMSSTALAQNYGNNQDTSQSSNSNIAMLAQDLQASLNLTQAQSDSVKSILKDYQNAINSSPSAPQMNNARPPEQVADARIEALLNDTQKTKWESMKTDWWDKVKSTLSSQ